MEKHRLILWTISCMWVNVNYKIVHQPIPTRENRGRPGNFQNEWVSSAFNWVFPFYFLKWNHYFSACKRKILASTSQSLHQSSQCTTKHNSCILFLVWSLYALVKSSLLKCKILGFSSARVKICQIPHVASIFSAIKKDPDALFLAQTLYTLFKRSPLKCKFLRFWSARVKIRRIPHVNFELTSQFLLKFWIILHCHNTKPSVNFKLMHLLLWIKGPHQSSNF